MKRYFLFLTVVILFQVFEIGISLAIFEIRILSFNNPRNMLASGHCCSTKTAPPIISGCQLGCNTIFHMCVDDFHLSEPNCLFGKTQSAIFNASNLHYNDTDANRLIQVIFHSSWPGKFGIRMDIYDTGIRSLSGKGYLIQDVSFVDSKRPSLQWYSRNSTGPVSSLLLKYRIKCGLYYYGPNCTSYCRGRNDEHGHYICNANGERMCLAGWINSNDYCRQPQCIPSCIHGMCIAPNNCRCHHGWTGNNCSVCVTRSGCRHGSCTTPGDCICDRGWGGVNCDKEMDYCGMRAPCKNSGTCINMEPGPNFFCICRAGFTGTTCETKITACLSNPCQNGAKCEGTTDGFNCSCPVQYTGVKCETFLDLCLTVVCRNNGTCIVTDSGASCNCAEKYTGKTCEHEISTATYVSTFHDFQAQSTKTTEESDIAITMQKSLAVTSKSITFGIHLKTISSSSSLEIRTVSELTSTINRHKAASIIIQPSLPVYRTRYPVSPLLTVDDSPISSTNNYLTSGNSSVSFVDINKGIRRRDESNTTVMVAIIGAISAILFTSIVIILLWRKRKKNGKIRRRASTVMPCSTNIHRNSLDQRNSCRKSFTESSISIVFETSVDNSNIIMNNNDDKSRIIQDDKDILSKIEKEEYNGECSTRLTRKDNNADTLSFINNGYLSETTSGYNSDSSSSRSSATHRPQFPKSKIDTNNIHVLSTRISRQGDLMEDLPNCIVYNEERL